MFWVLLLVVGALLFYYYLIKPQLYWREKNVPQGPPYPIMGNNLKTVLQLESTTDMIQSTYQQSKTSNTRYVGLYQGTKPILMICDADLIKQISVKDFDHFVDHMAFISEEQEPLFTSNLLSLKGDKWRTMRAILSPTFTTSKMRAMFCLMEQSAQQYVDFYLKQNKQVVEMEFKDSLTRYANDVIGNCAFGVTVDSLKQPNNEFYLNVKSIANINGVWMMLKLLLFFVVPKITAFFRLRLFKESATQFFQALVRDTVKLRTEQNIHRPDMINLLMEARAGKLKYEESQDNDTGFSTAKESDIGKKSIKQVDMTDDDMTAQVLIFFFAGFDTMSTMMSFLCYELAMNPDVQKKLIEEIDVAHKENGGKLTYDVLNKMKYLDMCISENLRKTPPFTDTDRSCVKPYTILPERPNEVPIHLKVGDVVMFPMCGIQHDEKYFPNPEKFDPERFSDENKDNIVPYSYLPFGAGPRNCIGSRFALMECKTLMYHILRNFEIVVVKKTAIPLKLARDAPQPAIQGGCWLGLQRRNNTD